MAYSNVDDLKIKIDETALIQLTDTAQTGRIDTAKVDRAVRDADALVDSYVSRVYKVPMNPVPNVIVDISSTMAIMNLHRFRSLESAVWKNAYDAAVSFLIKVSQGSATLEGAVKEPAPSDNTSSSASFDSAPRQFTRDSLKGM